MQKYSLFISANCCTCFGWYFTHHQVLITLYLQYLESVAYPGILLGGGGGSTNSVENRENRDLRAVAPLVRGSGGSCNLVQEISFHIVKVSKFFVL